MALDNDKCNQRKMNNLLLNTIVINSYINFDLH